MLTGTLSGAARLLHVTQPAATQTLQLAELQLGYKLFSRQKNRLVPTAEALVLVPEVQKLIGQLEAVRRLAEAQKSDAATPLRLLVVPSLAVVQLPAALRPFRQRHPGASVTLAEVVRQPFIRIDERDPLGALLAEQCARAGLKPGGEIVVQTHHTALVLAEQGFGPAVIDSFTAAARQDPALCVQAIEPEIHLGLYALQPPGTRSPRVAAAFIEAFLRTVVRTGPVGEAD